ncbi:MAG: hypothetical protein JWM95_532 [Gemmatimonadetes bacterium]|nr:hypothetical protein [Gemmatimonadota bacterium]
MIFSRRTTREDLRASLDAGGKMDEEALGGGQSA